MIARRIRVRGIVQGVGFRPFVYRLARAGGLCGWVRNEEAGVAIQIEGPCAAVEHFARALVMDAPPAAQISGLEMAESDVAGFADFVIRDSESSGAPSTRISPDLPVCDDCLKELFDPTDARYRYPYINCTHCGPRFTVIENLPYDRASTTMRRWPMDEICAAQYRDPLDRRFHAQPLCCPACGPHYFFESWQFRLEGDSASIEATVRLLREGGIIGIKGIGGYHLSCDARNETAVLALRERKFRKEKPFAIMVRDLDVARTVVDLSEAAEKLLCSPARPIVLAPAKLEIPQVAPGNHELGVMLPYAPLHYLLFAAGAPEILVLTSANRSSEPIAYRDQEARERLSGLADALLVGERPIARRVDDSVARAGVFGPMILRRSRGYAPGAVAILPAGKPILALGADLKNTIALVVGNQAFVSQHIGDLDHYQALTAFKETIGDLMKMYEVGWEDVTVVHDSHPEYASTAHALQLPAEHRYAVQHHRAHVASVLAERQAWERRAVGVSFDGTGYGDDGTIWGGEFFVGSVAEGWKRVLHLRPALLPGGDAAARFPVQCAAGFLSEIADSPNLLDPPFNFPDRYLSAQQMVTKRVRTFPTSSMGRFFDTVAALLGFTREISFEGQAAIWLEQLARTASVVSLTYPFPVIDDMLDFRPLLAAIIRDRCLGKCKEEIARTFHRTVALAISEAARRLCEQNSIDLAVLSGGVFQNDLLLREISDITYRTGIEYWINSSVPPNDGGISLGQAACAAFQSCEYF